MFVSFDNNFSVMSLKMDLLLWNKVGSRFVCNLVHFDRYKVSFWHGFSFKHSLLFSTRQTHTHLFACEMCACMLTLCVHLLFKVLIIQFYVLLFTDKLQRVVFLIFSRNLCSTNLKSDYEYAFSQATSIEHVHICI